MLASLGVGQSALDGTDRVRFYGSRSPCPRDGRTHGLVISLFGMHIPHVFLEPPDINAAQRTLTDRFDFSRHFVGGGVVRITRSRAGVS